MFTNRHSNEIDKIITNLEKNTGPKWELCFKDTTHNIVADAFCNDFFANLVQSRFTKKYLSNFVCVDCGGPAQHRCHEIGNSRPMLLKRALETVWPDTTKTVSLREIAIEFFRQHKTTNFDFKCKTCQDKEVRDPKILYEQNY